MSNRPPQQRVFIGACVVVIGVLALIDRLDIFEVRHVFQFWPSIFIVIGFLKIAKSRKRSSLFTGLGFIMVGILMTLSHFDIIHFSWGTWWPVILIAVGFSVMFKERHDDEYPFSELKKDNDSRLDVTAIMSGSKTVCSAKDFKFGDVTAIMGGVELDLRGASIETEAVLDVLATWGGVVVKVPQDWVIVNRGFALLGAMEDKTVPSANAQKRLIITGTALMGGVEIRN